MARQLYRFQLQDEVSPGIYAAIDDADQSRVTIIEVRPRSDKYPEDLKDLDEIANRVGCEVFSAGAYRYLVSRSEVQTNQITAELRNRGLLAKPAPASEKISHKPRRVLPILIALCLLIAAAVALYIFMRPPETLLRLEGSTTIGNELAPRLLVGFLRSKGAKDIQELPMTPQNKTHHDVRATLAGQWRPVIFSVIANGSGNSFKALHSHQADIGMSSRPINDKEVDLLSGEGNMRSPCCETIIGLDGLAVVVNDGNPVDELSREQLGLIFHGTIHDWSQVGGRPGPIHLYGRKPDSGTFDTFVDRVLKGDKAAFAPSLQVKESGDEITAAVASDAGGIGYVGLAQIHPAKALQISDGPNTASLLPSPFTVGTEDYVLSRRLFLYTPAQPTELAREFAEYAASPEGQEIVESVGYVKQTPSFENPPIPAAAPAAYRARVEGLSRLSINFRFQSNSDKLDNKALADIPRVRAALFEKHIRTGVQVIGFADSKGSASGSQKVSDQRAKVIAEKLRAYGIEVQDVGFGSAMPVADNDTDEGRQKNRRVEVWAKQ